MTGLNFALPGLINLLLLLLFCRSVCACSSCYNVQINVQNPQKSN